MLRKYNDCKESYRRMREVSDRLCKEHTLSVIKYPQGKKKNYLEWSAEKNGKPTYASMVKADIDRAILASTTMRDFNQVMEQMGYTFNRYGKHGQPLAHPAALPPGAKRGVRLDRLGEDYTFEGITKRILQNMRKRIPFPEAEKRSLGRYRYKGSFRKGRKATGLRALYLYYCYKLKIIVKRPGSVKQIPASLREDIVKLDRRIEETRFLGKHQIETAADLDHRKQYAQTQIQVLTDQRQELRNTLKRVTRLGDTEAIAEAKAQISALTGELKQYRREVKLCDSIAERSGLIKENLNAIIEQSQTAERSSRDKGKTKSASHQHQAPDQRSRPKKQKTKQTKER